MRRIIAVTLGLTLVTALLGAAPVAAKKKPKKVVRTYSEPYEASSVGSADASGTCVDTNGCVFLGVGPTENYLSFEVVDDTGLPVAVTVGQDSDTSDGFITRIADVCGKTEEPIQIQPGLQVTIWIWALPSATLQCFGAGTTGSFTAKLSNLP